MTEFQQEEIETFKEYLRKRGAAPNTISAYSASVRLYFSLYSDINIPNLQSYKEYLLEHFKANTATSSLLLNANRSHFWIMSFQKGITNA